MYVHAYVCTHIAYLVAYLDSLFTKQICKCEIVYRIYYYSADLYIRIHNLLNDKLCRCNIIMSCYFINAKIYSVSANDILITSLINDISGYYGRWQIL